uniref:Uncharacterized protein n=1 Tax=Panagrolaimus sp. ES5 TaxID=591445 RepID=A0AC34FF93_9BILA
MDASTSSFDGAKPKMINGKIVWSGGPSCKQHFSLPISIIYYMATNPSTPKVYQKLIQSCKYFFEKNPILVAANMYGKTKLCLNEACDGDSEDDNDDEEYAKSDCCTDIDLNKLLSKIWLTSKLELTRENISTFTSLIYPKLYQCKTINLRLYYDIILFNDFKSCAPFLTDIYLQGVVIKNNEKSVMLDKILEIVPNIKNFHLNGKSCIDIDLKKLLTPIWVTNDIALDSVNISSFASSIYPKLYRWKKISLNVNIDVIQYNDFKSCSMFLIDIAIQLVKIIDDVGKVVMLDKTLEICPNVQNFEYYDRESSSMINAATMKKICKLKHLYRLKSFDLYIPEVFNVEDISTFVKGHLNTKIYLDFNGEISEEYKLQLDALVDTIIKSEAAKHLIAYDGQTEEKWKIMNDRYGHLKL